MRKITILTWKLIGCIIIFLILSVNTVSAINAQNNTNNNSSGDNDLLTTYNYKSLSFELPEHISTPPEIMDNWAGDYMLLDKFLNMLSIHPPHGHGFIYALKFIFYLITVILATLLWMVYNVGWLIVSVIWGVYVVVMQFVMLFTAKSIATVMDKLGNITSYIKYYNETRTVIDPEKVMGKLYNNIFHNTSGENNSSILGDGLLFYPVDPLNINPNINNSDNVTITNNDSDNNTNKTNDTVVYDVMNSSIGSDIPDENGNINCSNVTNSTNCINSNNIINSDNVVNSNYVSNSNGIANSSNIINSTNVTNSSNVTNSNTIVNSNNIIKSNIIGSSNDINDCNNLNGINNSINLNNSVNSINLKDSDNLINCNNVTNSSNSIGCNDSVLLINCINNRNATNCSNSTYVFDMENRTNEFRKFDGYLHVLSTQYCKNGSGTFNPNKIKVNESYPIDSTVVDKDGYITFFTAKDNDITSFYENLVEQIKILNKSMNSLNDTKEKSKTATIVMGVVTGIILIVSIVTVFITNGYSKTVETQQIVDEGESRLITTTTREVRAGEGFIGKGKLMVEKFSSVQRFFNNGNPSIVLSTESTYPVFANLMYNYGIKIAIVGFIIAGIGTVGTLVSGFGFLKPAIDDLIKEQNEFNYEDAVLVTSLSEKIFRENNKIIVD